MARSKKARRAKGNERGLVMAFCACTYRGRKGEREAWAVCTEALQDEPVEFVLGYLQGRLRSALRLSSLKVLSVEFCSY